MKILRWTEGLALKGSKRSEGIRRELRINCIGDRLGETRLGPSGHIPRMYEGNELKVMMNARLDGKRPRSGKTGKIEKD